MEKIKGTDDELAFWKKFVKTERFLKGWAAPIKTPELNFRVAEMISSFEPKRILDCGSGVVSILYGLTGAELVATDLLGDEYAKIFDYKDIPRPVAVAAENLSYKDEFDIVHMSNALDHCQNPALAFEKMFDAVRPGGWLIIQGFENEAEHENWQGMHQWNIKLVFDMGPNNNHLLIQGKKVTYHTPKCTGFQNIKLESGKTWFICTWKK